MCYNSMALDRSTQTFSFNFKLPPKAGIGLAILRSGTSDIPGRDTYNNPTNNFDNYDILGMLSFGLGLINVPGVGIIIFTGLLLILSIGFPSFIKYFRSKNE